MPTDPEAQVLWEELHQLYSSGSKRELNLLNLHCDLVKVSDHNLQDLRRDRLRLSEAKVHSLRSGLLLNKEAIPKFGQIAEPLLQTQE